MQLMLPAMANQADLEWISGEHDEDVLLRRTVETCIANPQSKPVVLLRVLENKVPSHLFRELEHELSRIDETLDLQVELAGARAQLQSIYLQRKSATLLAQLSEKPLSALTAEEVALLKSVGNKSGQNKA